MYKQKATPIKNNPITAAYYVLPLQLGYTHINKCAENKTTVFNTIQYRLHPTLSIIQPKGIAKAIEVKYVIIVALPASTFVKQNL